MQIQITTQDYCLQVTTPNCPNVGEALPCTPKKKKPVSGRYLENLNITLVICQISQTMIIQNDILTTESRRYEI